MKRIASIPLTLVVSLGLVWPAPAEAAYTFSGGGFQDQSVVGGVGRATAFDWEPSGDLLVASQNGVVFRWDGAGPAQPVLDITGAVCFQNEMGLLGLAVDPDFGAGQPFVYLYYTHRRGAACESAANHASRANRVSRFSVDNAGMLGNEQVLIDNIPAFAGNHNGGDLHFGNDELLYISVGDSGRDLQTGQGEPNNANARRLDLLNGKILRITRTGGIPAGNPFANGMSCAATGMLPGAPVDATRESGQQDTKRKQKKKQQKKKKKGKHKAGKKNKKNKNKNKNKHNRKRNRRDNRRNRENPPPAPIGVCGEIFAFGLRNPYRIAFDPDDNAGAQRFYINDVGGVAWEEINSGAAGADYGWNVREGRCLIGSTTNCPPDPFVSPIFAYSRSEPASSPFSQCNVITGGAFVPDASIWPDSFDDRYVFADLGCGKLFTLEGEGVGAAGTLLATGLPGNDGTHLAFGPDGALYYATFASGGEIRRISPI
jgi:glucose/arabinose dehydrogenase